MCCVAQTHVINSSNHHNSSTCMCVCSMFLQGYGRCSHCFCFVSYTNCTMCLCMSVCFSIENHECNLPFATIRTTQSKMDEILRISFCVIRPCKWRLTDSVCFIVSALSRVCFLCTTNRTPFTTFCVYRGQLYHFIENNFKKIHTHTQTQFPT